MLDIACRIGSMNLLGRGGPEPERASDGSYARGSPAASCAASAAAFRFRVSSSVPRLFIPKTAIEGGAVIKTGEKWHVCNAMHVHCEHVILPQPCLSYP